MLGLEEYILEKGLDAKIIRLEREMPTVAAAAAVLGTDEDSIVKSLLFQGVDGKVVLVIACGRTKVDTKKVAAISGVAKPRLAALDVVKDMTGYAVGGVPPVGHKEKVPVLVDERVLQRKRVYGGGGEPQQLVDVAPSDILAATGGVVADLVKA